jgi:PPOX class probable FMN-dependent enzyme
VHRANPAGFLNALRSFVDEHQTLPMSHDELTLTSVDDLRAVYRRPAQRSLDKEVDHLDRHCRDFIAHAPFVVLASADTNDAVDASPKGGPPGFVAVLDDHRLAVPDMAGNNRLDSMRNIVGGGAVALLFLVPGTDETLRVNGRATMTTAPAVLDRCPVGELRPHVAIVVAVRTAFIHCAKALRRATLWQPDEWPATSDMATPACMLRDHIGLDGSVKDSQRALDASYAATTWKVGSRD